MTPDIAVDLYQMPRYEYATEYRCTTLTWDATPPTSGTLYSYGWMGLYFATAIPEINTFWGHTFVYWLPAVGDASYVIARVSNAVANRLWDSTSPPADPETLIGDAAARKVVEFTSTGSQWMVADAQGQYDASPAASWGDLSTYYLGCGAQLFAGSPGGADVGFTSKLTVEFDVCDARHGYMHQIGAIDRNMSNDTGFWTQQETTFGPGAPVTADMSFSGGRAIATLTASFDPANDHSQCQASLYTSGLRRLKPMTTTINPLGERLQLLCGDDDVLSEFGHELKQRRHNGNAWGAWQALTGLGSEWASIGAAADPHDFASHQLQGNYGPSGALKRATSLDNGRNWT